MTTRTAALLVAAAVCGAGTVVPVPATGATGLTAAAAVSARSAAAPAALALAYEREWIYSSTSSEVPDAVAVDARGLVYVVAGDAGYGEIDSRVRVYDPRGRLVRTWPDIPVNLVGGMDVGPDGNLHVTDYAGRSVDDVAPSVKVYTPTGRLVRSYGLGDAGHWTAGGVAVGADGTSYVTDPVNGSVHQFAPDGTYRVSFGGEGTEPGRYDGPWDVELAGGRLVVADTGNDRIQVVSATTGAPVRRWGQAGTGRGQFHLGVGTVEVHGGHVYATDSTSRIQVFTLAGRFVGVVRPATRRGAGHLVDQVADVDFGPGRVMYVAGRLYPFENGVAKYRSVARPAVGVAARTVDANRARTRATLRVRCARDTVCAGRAVLRSGRTRLGAGTYRLAPNRTGRVQVRLTPAARTALGRQQRVRAVVVLRPAHGRPVTRRVVLTR